MVREKFGYFSLLPCLVQISSLFHFRFSFFKSQNHISFQETESIRRQITVFLAAGQVSNVNNQCWISKYVWQTYCGNVLLLLDAQYHVIVILCSVYDTCEVYPLYCNWNFVHQVSQVQIHQITVRFWLSQNHRAETEIRVWQGRYPKG